MVDKLNKQPTHVEGKQIEMMVYATVERMQSYIDGNFEMTTKIHKVDKGVLLTVPNPKYEELINKYHYLQGLVMDDHDKKSELLIHVILGASECSRIETASKPRVGQPSEPIAELTHLEWTMRSPA